MAQYPTNSDFSTDDDATTADIAAPNNITGWTVTSPAGSQAYRDWIITEDGAAEGGKYVGSTDTGWGTALGFLEFDDLATIQADTEYDWLMRFSLATVTAWFGAFIESSDDGYMLIPSATTLRLYKFTGASSNGSVGASVSVTIAADTWYWVRVHRTSDNYWSWKFWSGAYSSEPDYDNGVNGIGDGADGTGSVQDTYVTTGPTGLMRFFGSSYNIDWDWFSVGDAGSLAPGPGDGTSIIPPGALTTRQILQATKRTGNF